MAVEVHFDAVALDQTNPVERQSLVDWVNRNSIHAANSGEIIFDQAHVKGGWHASTGPGGVVNDNHLTVRLSNPELRARDDWYSMHFDRHGEGEIFSLSRLERAEKVRKSRADNRRKNKNNKRDQGGSGGGAGGGSSTGNASEKTSTKTAPGQKNSSAVDSTTTTGGTQTGTTRAAHGTAHILRGKEHHTKVSPTHAGMTTMGGRGAPREQSDGPDLGVNVKAKPHLKTTDGKKAAEIRELPHRSHPGPYTAQARYLPQDHLSQRGLHSMVKSTEMPARMPPPNRDHPGASVAIGYKVSATQGVNVNDAPPNATRVPSRRPDYRHGDQNQRLG